VLIGCGLPIVLGTTALILKIISEVDKPMVIDAGALGTLTGHLDILKKRTSPTILTPHAGEIARLVDRPVKEVVRDRLGVAREVAETTGCIVVMKGAPTYVVSPDKKAYINTTGNPGLATAGTGDVLAGMITSFLSQTPERPRDAAMAAVYIHGLAGDFSAKEKTTHSMTATDVIAHLPQAFKSLGVE
jgi:ADP-dependent NAD(P)H-hydrate dehydratase / NAD(P)H-hydrate epimerase